MTGGLATSAALTVHFAPWLGHGALIAVLVAGAVLFALSAVFYRRGLLWRALVFAAFLMLFMNPVFVEEQREPIPDIAVVVVDHSPSQAFGRRLQRTETALQAIKTQMHGNRDVKLRIVTAPAAGQAPDGRTRLFQAADQAFADVPVARRAGLILLTDGQVHDVPNTAERLNEYGPIDALLSGDRNEHDRQLIVDEAPAYGIVGQDITIRYKIADTRQTHGTAPVTIRANGQSTTHIVPVNIDQTLSIKIDHAGQNIFTMTTPPVAGEITDVNNKAPVIVNGVRDRLRVLLVSGQPHNGGRLWRDMMTSDPGVDLVHFTILREPDKLDATPQDELALIAFPFHELFDVKLYNFDLIIFDRYHLNRILPDYYFSNIAKYVREGGALLEASGPAFATDDSIYNTELRDILPASPTGAIYEQPFRPTLTTIGKRHPVTENLIRDNKTQWGPWLRQIGVHAGRGETLMTGVNGLPLLVLDRVGKGRVAQLASDQIWLWSRGYDGGGPYTELLRRLVHWLMKEPELEENALNVRIDGGTMTVRRHTLDQKPMDVRITAPDGTTGTLHLNPVEDGLLQGQSPAPMLGVYAVDDGTQTRYAVNGAVNPPEFKAVVTTDSILAPVVKASQGTTVWLADTPHPTVRVVPEGRSYGGKNWIGLRHSDSYNVTGVRERPLLPIYGWAVLLLGLIIGTWWMEGRKPRHHG